MNKKHPYLKEKVWPGIFADWQEVDVEILTFSELGISVAINDEYLGLVYKDNVYKTYREGQKLKAYIKSVRKDGKIDISFQPLQGKHVYGTADKIMKHLKAAGGTSTFNDKSRPEDIRQEFQVSKKVFKQAVGKLYKEHKIKITEHGIELYK